MQTIHYTNGTVVHNAVIQIWPDLHNERAGFFRAFWCASPEATTGSPVIGYCSPGGSHRKPADVIAEVRRLYPNEPIYYQNGRRAK